jgi:hypothetical protein
MYMNKNFKSRQLETLKDSAVLASLDFAKTNKKVGEKIANDNIQFQPLGAMTFLRKDNNLNRKKFG